MVRDRVARDMVVHRSPPRSAPPVRTDAGKATAASARKAVRAARVRDKVKVRGLDDPSTVMATPALYPEYSPEVTDYVTPCNGDPVQIDADAGPRNSIDVDGQGARKGEFTTGVPLQAGQRFSFVRATGAGQATHHVRCLPADFPEWTYEKFAPAQQQWYIVVLGQYVIVIDGNGVPVWWFDDPGSPADAKFLENGTFAWVTERGTPMARYEMRIPNGSLVREMKTVATMTDGHDLQLLANGNYLYTSSDETGFTVSDLTAAWTAVAFNWVLLNAVP